MGDFLFDGGVRAGRPLQGGMATILSMGTASQFVDVRIAQYHETLLEIGSSGIGGSGDWRRA